MGNSNSKSSSSSSNNKQLQDYYVGQTIILNGTGRRWAGNTFSARICDLRGDDQTVKVQFSDGGYKRFDLKKFEELLTFESRGATASASLGSGGKPLNRDMSFGTQAYEWYYENYAPDVSAEEVEISESLEKLRQDISTATRKGEFAEAAKLSNQFKELQSKVVEGYRLKEALLTAVQSENFEEAAKVKGKLSDFQLKRKRSLVNAKDSNTASQAQAALNAAGESKKEQKPFGEVLQNAGKRALGGGIAGAAAMVVQVSTLMWIRTIMNYQYRYGTSLAEATRHLYNEGGILRFYRGYWAGLAQGPLSRFGDTAANAGMLAILDANPSTASLPAAAKTVGASAAAATWRIFLTPIDTVKTILQVEGKPGLKILTEKAKVKGPTVYYHGATAAAAATFAGHYPWFATYNTLQEMVPQYDEKPKKLARNAAIGFTSSVISDTVSNSLRVIKTYRQTSAVPVTYSEAVRNIVEQDGYVGLFGRGLQTRIIANGMQGLMFSVMWKMFDEEMKKKGWF